MPAATILVVDDESLIRWTLSERLSQVPGALRVEILGESGTEVEARVYPEKSAAATLTRSVAELAARENWQLDEVHTEEGRLDEVFRTITLPDTVKARAQATTEAAS